MSTERENAMALANRLLDDTSADPDDDLRVLARTLVRRGTPNTSTVAVLAVALYRKRRDMAGLGVGVPAWADWDADHQKDCVEFIGDVFSVLGLAQ